MGEAALALLQFPVILTLLSDLVQMLPPLVKYSRFLHPCIQLLSIIQLQHKELHSGEYTRARSFLLINTDLFPFKS